MASLALLFHPRGWKPLCGIYKHAQTAFGKNNGLLLRVIYIEVQVEMKVTKLCRFPGEAACINSFPRYLVCTR